MDVMVTNADWFARLLGIFAILISAVILYLRIRHTRQQRPIIKVEQSEIVIQNDFDAHSQKCNSDLLRRYSEYTFPSLLAPVEVTLVLKNEGLISTAVTDMEISLQSIPLRVIDRFKFFFLEKLRKRGRTLGDIVYIGDEDEPFLYLMPDQLPMRLPYNVEAGSLIKCEGTLYLHLRMTDKVFEDYKRHRPQLETPLDCVDFVLNMRGYNREKACFRLLLLSGAKILCNTLFNRNEWIPGYWFRHG